MKSYLFCNAHLDPVWLWQWEQGLSEAISTFRAATEFVDEYPDFIFNHNESLLYEWIEEHEPDLFETIKRQVKEGRWRIVGGWFLQPDCNIPSGESIFRQVLRGRLYFYDKFGEVPVTAVNVDSFGHAQGLVQMLKQSGYEYYVNIRPHRDNYDFDSEDFVWRGYDGSEILVHRSDRGYNSVFGTAAEELQKFSEKHKDEETALFLWGVGNHGGGASRKDLNDLNWLKSTTDLDFVHSHPDEYFTTVQKENLPLVDRGLNTLMEGCYTSIIRIKQMHRQLENDLVMIEKMASHAAIQKLSTYEKALIDDAWRDLLFAEFHDALPGSCIQPVEEDTIRILQHGLEITDRLKAKYLIALSAGEEKIKDPNSVPVMVYNPHPFPYTQPIDLEFTLPKQLWHKEFSNPIVYQDGVRIPCQSAKESGNFYMDWCKRVIFKPTLPPTSLTRFDIFFEVIEKRPTPEIHPERPGVFRIPTAKGSVTVNCRTGLVDSMMVDGKEYLKPGAFALRVYGDSFNCWEGKGGYLPKNPEGAFSLMTPGEATDFAGVKFSLVRPVRVTDDGEVQTVIEADMKYRDSRLLVRYIVNKISGTLEVALRVFNAENEKRLRLDIPTTLENPEWMGQTIFGREKLKHSYGDTVSQYWQTLSDGEHAVAFIDNGVYGSYVDGSQMGLTLLRSAGYGAGHSAWGMPFRDPMYQQRMDQGERNYRFRIECGKAEDIMKCVDRQAAMFNQVPAAMPFCPSGKGKKPLPLIRIDNPNITLSCFKMCEREEGNYIIRLFENSGIETKASFELPFLRLTVTDTFKPFEIKTYKLRGAYLDDTDILEGAIPLK